MIATRSIRAVTAIAATAALLTLAAALPATAANFSTAAPTAANEAYPIDRGIVTLESQNHWSKPRAVLQETGDKYPACACANNVVASPARWNIDQQRWRLIQTGKDTYRLINVYTGHALQSTNEWTSEGFNIVATPAEWNAPQQEFRIYPLFGQAGQDIVIWAKGAPGYADASLGVRSVTYPGYSDVFTVGTSVGWGFWTISGYTFPAS